MNPSLNDDKPALDDEESIFGGGENLEDITSIFTEALPSDAPAPTEVQGEDDAIDPQILKRRADIDGKQARVAGLLEEMGCEGVVLLMPAHVTWFTGGMNVRGLIADGERPGVYTNGRQRWLLASNIDAQRLFDEELDGLGFQLKEWQWSVGRPVLLGELVAGKKFATDRPFPSMPLINDRLRPEIRPLTEFEQGLYLELGRAVAHAVEATARNVERGETEQEIAGHLAHRLYRHGIEATTISVAADGRAQKVRRAGFTEAAVESTCVLQATGYRDGLYATVSRTICFGPPADAFRTEYELAAKMAAVYRAMSVPDGSVGVAAEMARKLVANSPHEYEWRHSQPGYGAGRFVVEELRKAGQDEKFGLGWPLVWQAKIGSAAVVDTVIVDQYAALPVTPPEGWPFKRIKLRERVFDVPDLLVRLEE
ncbi:M24 family metallopeptidase [Limnoglobus roseus]|uniref:Peptidase M24 domain-containing protein n=1 Tax=Limnoglobus roseus TaxID=2598579 RepID=A0A5C1A5Y7_9BACT|nr:M24 family metallopeptidase [Limnoglobus roseus]QEL13687.1 hypothetical protein PX52LOC_00545 [Limnoglobus roseus]